MKTQSEENTFLVNEVEDKQTSICNRANTVCALDRNI